MNAPVLKDKLNLTASYQYVTNNGPGPVFQGYRLDRARAVCAPSWSPGLVPRLHESQACTFGSCIAAAQWALARLAAVNNRTACIN